jgi:hypothetical protein
MTVLIGASVLLIAGSAIALVFGWTGADQSLIWTSIAATAAAAVALALAYFRSRSEPAASRVSGSAQPAAATEAAAPAASAPPTRDEPTEQQVVAVASTKKFHKPDCRYASAASGTKMSAADARKQSYAPCGICKP